MRLKTPYNNIDQSNTDLKLNNKVMLFSNKCHLIPN